MGRIRTIKPDLTLDEEFAELGFAARYFFVNLLCQCDKAGRCEDRPKKLQVLILPWDKIDADKLMDELSPKFIIRYEVNGIKYLQVRTWEKHQRPLPNERESVIPPPSDVQQMYNKCMTSVIPLTLRKGSGNGREVEGNRERSANGDVFIPPTLDEVRTYCLEQQNGVDPEAFLAHYNTVGWVYGQRKVKIKCWKSCVTTWKKRTKKMTLDDLSK